MKTVRRRWVVTKTHGSSADDSPAAADDDYDREAMQDEVFDGTRCPVCMKRVGETCTRCTRLGSYYYAISEEVLMAMLMLRNRRDTLFSMLPIVLVAHIYRFVVAGVESVLLCQVWPLRCGHTCHSCCTPKHECADICPMEPVQKTRRILGSAALKSYHQTPLTTAERLRNMLKTGICRSMIILDNQPHGYQSPLSDGPVISYDQALNMYRATEEHAENGYYGQTRLMNYLREYLRIKVAVVTNDQCVSGNTFWSSADVIVEKRGSIWQMQCSGCCEHSRIVHINATDIYSLLKLKAHRSQMEKMRLICKNCVNNYRAFNIVDCEWPFDGRRLAEQMERYHDFVRAIEDGCCIVVQVGEVNHEQEEQLAGQLVKPIFFHVTLEGLVSAALDQ